MWVPVHGAPVSECTHGKAAAGGDRLPAGVGETFVQGGFGPASTTPSTRGQLSFEMVPAIFSVMYIICHHCPWYFNTGHQCFAFILNMFHDFFVIPHQISTYFIDIHHYHRILSCHVTAMYSYLKPSYFSWCGLLFADVRLFISCRTRPP